MKKEELLKQIEKLRAMVEFDCETQESEEAKYEKWIDELQGRLKPYLCKSGAFTPFDNKKYNKYSLLKCMVEDLYVKMRKDPIEYYKEKHEIRRIIAEIVAMTMFYEEQYDELPKFC